MEHFDDRDTVRRMLLGSSSEEEARQIKWRMDADAAYREYAEAVEEELIDEYLREALSTEDRARFEGVYLSAPERRDKVDEARVLFEVIQRRVAPKVSSRSKVIIGVAGVVVILLAAWYGIADREVAYSLRSGLTRDVAPGQVIIAPRTGLVRLRLQADTAESATHAELRTVEPDEQIWRQKLPPDSAHSGELLIPGQLLPRGRCILFLERNGERIASFTFRIEKK